MKDLKLSEPKLQKVKDILGKLIAKAYTKKKDIKVEFTVAVDNWEMNVWGKERVLDDMLRGLERKIVETIENAIRYEVDQEVCRKLAAELLEEYDFKAAIKRSMQEKVEQFLRSPQVPVAGIYDANAQRNALTRGGY